MTDKGFEIQKKFPFELFLFEFTMGELRVVNIFSVPFIHEFSLITWNAMEKNYIKSTANCNWRVLILPKEKKIYLHLINSGQKIPS